MRQNLKWEIRRQKLYLYRLPSRAAELKKNKNLALLWRKSGSCYDWTSFYCEAFSFVFLFFLDAILLFSSTINVLLIIWNSWMSVIFIKISLTFADLRKFLAKILLLKYEKEWTIYFWMYCNLKAQTDIHFLNGLQLQIFRVLE